MFADLEVGALSRIMRPTILSAVVAGVIAVGVALLLSSTPAAVGIVIGIAVAILNVRMLGARVTKVETDGTNDNKVVRKILRRGSAVRLLVVTVVAVGLVLIAPPLGIGMVVGLVIFQIAFVVNAGRAVLSAGIV
ncbi:MAG: ATP synthase subunit I [Actinomycetes bacterium]